MPSIRTKTSVSLEQELSNIETLCKIVAPSFHWINRKILIEHKFSEAQAGISRAVLALFLGLYSKITQGVMYWRQEDLHKQINTSLKNIKQLAGSDNVSKKDLTARVGKTFKKFSEASIFFESNDAIIQENRKLLKEIQNLVKPVKTLKKNPEEVTVPPVNKIQASVNKKKVRFNFNEVVAIKQPSKQIKSNSIVLKKRKTANEVVRESQVVDVKTDKVVQPLENKFLKVPEEASKVEDEPKKVTLEDTIHEKVSEQLAVSEFQTDQKVIELLEREIANNRESLKEFEASRKAAETKLKSSIEELTILEHTYNTLLASDLEDQVIFPAPWHKASDLCNYAQGFVEAGRQTFKSLNEFLLTKMDRNKVAEPYHQQLKDFIAQQNEILVFYFEDQQQKIEQAIATEFDGKVIAHGKTTTEMKKVKNSLRKLAEDIQLKIETFCDAFKARAEEVGRQIESNKTTLEQNGLNFAASILLPQVDNAELSNSMNFMDSFLLVGSVVGEKWFDLEKGNILDIGKGLETFDIEALKADIRAYFNKHRLAHIHAHPLWTKRHESKPLFRNSIKSISTFEGVGPAYSSAAVRNRTTRDAVLPNFLRTTYDSPSNNEQERIFHFFSTRSATPSEFDQKDIEMRQKVTDLLVSQVLSHCAQEHLNANPFASDDEEINISFQWVALLTDSSMVSVANASAKRLGLYTEIFNDSKDESAFIRNTYEALKSFDRQNFTYQGKTFKFDIQLWNTPCNFTQEAVCQYISRSPGAVENACNSKALVKLERDVFLAVQKIEEELSEIQGLEAGEVSAIQVVVDQKAQLRNGLKSGQNRNQFLDLAKKLATLTRAEKRCKKSDELKKYLMLIERKECLLDLHCDITSIFENNLIGNLAQLDYNPYALPARLLAIGHLLNYKTHFGCRSGKDRTGFSDIETKLFIQATEQLGRCPAYWEQEHLDFIDEYREEIIRHSLNFDVVIEANLGGNLGANIDNCYFVPRYEGKYTPEQLKKKIATFHEITGAAKDVFDRPKA